MSKSRASSTESAASEAESRSAIAPVYALVGEDEYLKRDWLLRIRSDREKSSGSCDVLSFGKEEGTPEPPAVFDELRTRSLFGGFKIVVIDPADDFARRHAELIVSYLKAPAGTASLILSVSETPTNKDLAASLRKRRGLVELSSPRRGELVRWIIDRAKEHGKQIETQAAAMLAERVGEKPGLLDGTLRRLAQQIGERLRITVSDVETGVRDERQRAFYEISAAIARAETPTALAALHSLLLRETPSDVYRGLVPYLASYVGRIKAISELSAQGMNPGEVQKAVGHAGAYFLVKEAAALPSTEIDRLAEDIARIDYQLKTSGGSELMLLESLIVSLCRGPRRQAAAQRDYR